MKGRVRPISLKTDVIKNRRSKSKVSKVRGESRSRTRDTTESRGAGGGKGEEGESEEMGEEERRDRRSGGIGNGNQIQTGQAYHYGAPHAHQPYPPPAARAGSSATSSRRAQSLDARPTFAFPRTSMAEGGTYPTLAYSTGTHLEGYYSYYPSPYPPPPPTNFPVGFYPPPQSTERYPVAPHPLLLHVQSDSRSQSPSLDEPRIPPPGGDTPTNPLSNYYPPMPHYPIPIQPSQPYAQSPLSSSNNLTSRPAREIDQGRFGHTDSRQSGSRGILLAPIGAGKREDSRERVVLPGFGLVASPGSREPTKTRYIGAGGGEADQERSRRSRARSSSDASGSSRSEGVGEVGAGEIGSQPLPPGGMWSLEENRRGRSETRTSISSPALINLNQKGKQRALDLSPLPTSSIGLDEVDELDEDFDIGGTGDDGNGMVGVEMGLEELRFSHHRPPSLDKLHQERSNSSRSGGESRDRASRGRSTTGGGGARVRSSSRASGSTNGGEPTAEVLKLRLRVTELEYMNGLLLSRLRELEI